MALCPVVVLDTLLQEMQPAVETSELDVSTDCLCMNPFGAATTAAHSTNRRATKMYDVLELLVYDLC